MIQLISLGAGVQSSTMALMAAHGEIEPMPDGAIFADTGWEPLQVYTWLAWLEKQLPFPVHRVSIGNIREDQVSATFTGKKSDGKLFASLPLYMKHAGGVGTGRRQCTREYKIDPITKKVREMLGLKFRQRSPKTIEVMQWIGISLDEALRIKPNQTPFIQNRWPLAMEKRMTRQDCFAWMEKHGYPRPPRSACIGCPYRDNKGWRDMRDNDPVSWRDAVAFDKVVRNSATINSEAYLHRDCVPLDEVDLMIAEDFGQTDMFNDECEGMCGV